MINFFRKLRSKFLEQNKLGKYLVYALGEIILVVIGILIALQVNNWNNKKIELKNEIIYLKEIEKSLSFEFENEIIGAREFTENQIRFYNLYNEGLKKYPDGISNDSIQNLLAKWIVPWGLVINTVPVENLNSIGIDLISNSELRSELSQFYGFDIPWVLQHNEEHRNWNKTNIYPFLHDNLNMHDKKFRNDQIEFLKTNLASINRFNAHHTYYLKGFVSRLINLEAKANDLLNNIRIEIAKLDRK